MLKALPATLVLVFSQAGWAVDPTINVGASNGLPRNGTVVSGAATGSVTGNQLTVDQSSGRAVLDWTSFTIDAGKSVLFNQPSVSSAVLNRVNGDANASQILGNLSANGTVMLMNPNGVMFGASSVVNVGSLIATTGTIDRSAFENSGHANITGAAGSITNLGSITATAGTGGLVALVAPSVVNQGSIMAAGGTIALAGSSAATISLNGGLYEFTIPGGATGTAVTNAAGASLNAATIRLGVGDAANLVSGVINLEGVQQATSAIVVNGDTVVLKSALQAPSVSGNSNTVNVFSGARIQDAVNIAKTGTPGAGATVNVGAGSYAEQVALNKANITLAGAAGAKLIVPDATDVNGVSIQANNVTVSGMEIAGPLDRPYYQYYASPAPSNISRGIAVAEGVTGFTIRNNNIHDVRTGILLHGRNSIGSVTNNRIENTKSGISVQYTDGTGITMAGNTQGPVGNEWGLNLHLNGHLDGSNNIVSNSTPISAAPTLAWQQSLLALSTGNAGWSVQDQAYTSSNRTHVNVTTGGSSSAQGSVLTPLNSIQDGVNAVVVGGTVNVGAGTFSENVTLNTRRDLAFNDTHLQSLRLNSGAAGSGIGGAVTAEGPGGFSFENGASVRLLSDTTLATTGADINLAGDIQNANGVARGLRLIAGTGATRGNVVMTTGGSEGNFLGRFDVSARKFDLGGTLWVSSYKIDALGDVALSNTTLRAQDAGAVNTLSAGGNVTGSTNSQGRVEIVSGGDIVANIKAPELVANALRNIDAVLDIGKSAALESGGATNVSGSAPSLVIDAPRGSVSGSFGQVSNIGSGLINVNGKPQTNQTVSSNAENNRVVPLGDVWESGSEDTAVQLAQTGDLARQGGPDISLSTPEAAGEALDSGRAVELDMSPRKQRGQNNKKDKEEKEQDE